MSAEANKQLMKSLFDELAKGNSRPYLAALSDDFELTVTGQTPWSGTWKGRAQVRAFYDAALAAGAADNGPPGLRPRYGETYYAAFVFDPDGHNIEAVNHNR